MQTTSAEVGVVSGFFIDIYGKDGNKYTMWFKFDTTQLIMLKNDSTVKTW